MSLSQPLCASVNFRPIEKTPKVDQLLANVELGTLGTWNFDNNAILTQFSQQCPTSNH